MPANEKNNTVKVKPLLVFSPLDWGFGHTIRSIPLVRAFMETGFEVVVACNSTQRDMLARELPDVSFELLKSHEIKYGKNVTATRWQLLRQIPDILIQINSEHKWLQQFIGKFHPQAVFSDNRYGFFSPFVPSVLMTHQLAPASGLSASLDKIGRALVFKYINRFAECWIPDSYSQAFAGKLSHPAQLPKTPLKYLGLVSRFSREFYGSPIDKTPFVRKYCVILSGPEPQRSILEELILDQMQHEDALVVVRGIASSEQRRHHGSITMIDYAAATELKTLIMESEFIVCRAGYTSIMDLLTLQKKMILIPTPGQPEQEYLAQHLKESGFAYSCSQDGFSFSAAIKAAGAFEYKLAIPGESYRRVVEEFAGRITSSALSAHL